MAWLDARPRAQVDMHFLAGFTYDGERISLLDRQRGIRKPLGWTSALAIRTTYTPPGATPPYVDAVGADGLQRYMYRGTDPSHPENRALRNAMERRQPLIWFVGVAPGLYDPIYPVYIVADEPASLQFAVALDEAQRFVGLEELAVDEDRRAYVERITRQRLHQRVFRTQVLLAYEDRCALCSLKRAALLDAAHIIGDKEDGGEPIVPNGLSMCKIHHAAFDVGILGVRPDLSVHVRDDVLAEIDGPMLRHGIQDLHNQRLLVLPRQRAARPDTVRLEARYARFLDAG